GLVNADNYKVCNGKIIDKKISTKKLAIYALEDGGTKEQEIEPERQNRQALTDEQILQLEQIGRTIEEHFGRPQDIEWCLVDDTRMLASPASRHTLINTLGPSDPLIRDALVTIVEREGFIKSPPDDEKEQGPGRGDRVVSPSGFRTQVENDPAIASDLIKKS